MSFQIALTGLNAASADLAVTANNIANANTTAFKSSRVEFANVFTADAVSSGSGVQVSIVREQFGQGAVEFTGRQLDMAVSGNGFFITDDEGSDVYTRAGSFGLGRGGFIENAEGNRLQVYPPTIGGGFNTGVLADVQLTSDLNPPVASTKIDTGINLPANATQPIVAPFDAADANTFNHSTTTIVHDSLGTAHTATSYYVKNAAIGNWQVHLDIDGTAVGNLAVQFGNDGRVATPVGGQLAMPAFAPGNGANALQLDIELGTTTQFGSTFVINSLAPDGSAAGRLRSIDIDQTGVIFARFSNGGTQALGKIALADFPNVEGLQQTSDTGRQETFSSGPALRGEATLGTFGAISSGSMSRTGEVDYLPISTSGRALGR